MINIKQHTHADIVRWLPSLSPAVASLCFVRPFSFVSCHTLISFFARQKFNF